MANGCQHQWVHAYWRDLAGKLQCDLCKATLHVRVKRDGDQYEAAALVVLSSVGPTPATAVSFLLGQIRPTNRVRVPGVPLTDADRALDVALAT